MRRFKFARRGRSGKTPRSSVARSSAPAGARRRRRSGCLVIAVLFVLATVALATILI